MNADIETAHKEKHISWIDILAVSACRTGGKCGLVSVKKAAKELSGNETLLDLYCGIGTISLALAQKAQQKVNVVAAVAEKLTAAQSCGVAPVVGAVMGQLLGPNGHHDDFAVITAVDQLLQLHDAGPVADRVGAHKGHILLIAGFDEPQALFLAVAQGLFHENVLFVGDDYGPGGNDESVYLSDIPFITIDDYRTFPDKVSALL